MTDREQTPQLSLYELNQLVRETIDVSMPDEYWVEAELAEVREVRGHCYMELVQKDVSSHTPVARASAKCWRSRWMLVGPYFERMTGRRLCAGLKVLLRVHADFHEAYGFSWIVTDIDPRFTMGDLARRRQEIIRILRQEGVLELQRELSLPMFTQRIAVISSENAAGYGDFCNQLLHNDYGLHFTVQLFSAVMQGEQVERSVIAALDRINADADAFDAVVIIRGGGATSELSGFDTLELAENVANFPLPVITGIGHERDESVLDLVAHTSVKTPTAAATFLIDHLATVLQRIGEAQEAVTRIVGQRLAIERMRIDRFASVIPMQFSVVKTSREAHLDNLFATLIAAVRQHLAAAEHRLAALSAGLPPVAERLLTVEQHRIDLLAQRVEAVDPVQLLNRGYSITLHNGRSVRDARSLRSGDEIETRVAHGTIWSVVK